MESGYGGGGRALPLYLLLDTSLSMQGVGIEALREGMQTLYDELMADQETRSKVKISVITFATDAKQSDLTPLKDFVPPVIQAAGVTRLDGALNLLAQSIQADVRLNTTTAHGDYCPLVFLLTDGVPTDENGYPSDNYKYELEAIRTLRYNHKPMIVALGCGQEVNPAVLQDITTNVLYIATVSGPQLHAFFQFISGSVKASAKATDSGGGGAVQLPPAPQGFSYNPYG